MERVLKVAVTGLGFSTKYIQNYIDAPETELLLLHDINGEHARATAKEFGRCRWTTNFDDVLASDADMLEVATPNHFHSEQAIAAMEAGKHVLCQKPMAPTVAECRRMVDASKRTTTMLGINITWMTNRLAPDIKIAIADGLLGDIASLRVRNAHRGLMGQKMSAGWRSDMKKLGGGVFMQLGVHPLALVLWMTGLEVISVMGYADNLYCRDVMQGEDIANGIAELSNGALLTMEAGYSSIGRPVEIYGTKGRAVKIENEAFIELAGDFDGKEFSYRRSALISEDLHAMGPTLHISGISTRGEWRHPEYNQNRKFAQAILAGEEPPVTGEHGMRDVAATQALYLSSREGRRVFVREVME